MRIETPFLIAHRGWSSVAPENTLAAFERALDAGARVLECDVQLTADGVVAVIHDPRLDRTTDGAGRVRHRTWEEVRSLDAGYAGRFGEAFAGQRVPRLEALLDLARGRARVFVEIKPEAVGLAPGEESVEARTVAAARATGTLDDLRVLSFAPRALAAVRSRAPRVPLGLVFRWWRHRRLVAEAAAAGVEYLVAYAARLHSRPGIVTAAHERGIRVGAYVVDDEATLARMVEIGVDGIATNRVGALLPVLEGLLGRDRQEGGPRAGSPGAGSRGPE